MLSCFDCRYLVQLGSGGNVCSRFDPYEEGGAWLDDDRPEPLYSDCHAPVAAAREGR